MCFVDSIASSDFNLFWFLSVELFLLLLKLPLLYSSSPTYLPISHSFIYFSRVTYPPNL